MEAANSQLQKEFLENLGQIATHADTADFTIACDGDEHRVHKLILSLHSKYFARLFKGGQFKVGFTLKQLDTVTSKPTSRSISSSHRRHR